MTHLHVAHFKKPAPCFSRASVRANELESHDKKVAYTGTAVEVPRARGQIAETAICPRKILTISGSHSWRLRFNNKG